MTDGEFFFCSTCHAVLDDGERRTWAEHCETEHPELVEVAGRSGDWAPAPST